MTELALWRASYRRVAGIDEVGRGPLAGPVVVGVVILPPFFAAEWLAGVRDSKLLTPRVRQRLATRIKEAAIACAVGVRSARQIDMVGLSAATRTATRDALLLLGCDPDFLLLDAFLYRDSPVDQCAIIRGDATCASIACASIVAKVARDRMLEGLSRCFPGYFFDQHKGYGTSLHHQALECLGPSPIHRRSFAPLRTNTDAAT